MERFVDIVEQSSMHIPGGNEKSRLKGGFFLTAYKCFQNVVQQVRPKYVSCIIQINVEDSWVSDSPYLRVFDRLEQVHHQMEEHTLKKAMLEISYHTINVLECTLPNGKKFVQMDFEHSQREK